MFTSRQYPELEPNSQQDDQQRLFEANSIAMGRGDINMYPPSCIFTAATIRFAARAFMFCLIFKQEYFFAKLLAGGVQP